MILEVSQLNLSFDQKPVLKDFSFALNKGEIACLLGPSGCGKTTALRTIAGFEQPDSGKIILNGKTLSDGLTFIPPHLRHVGMVFQDYALFPHLTAAQNIAFGIHKQSVDKRQQRVKELLDLIELADYGERYPHQLSGGQQQRIALARALAPKPELILLDEPFSNLDADLRTQLSKEIRQLLKKENTSAILVTHDQHEAFAIADKIGLMSAGRLNQWDTPYKLYHEPADIYTAHFIGAGVLLQGTVTDNQCIQLPVGTFHGPLPSLYKNGDELHVLIRPDDIVYDENSLITAEILDKDFKGNYFVYTLKINSGETISMQIPAHYNHTIGSHIGICMNLEHLIAFSK
ncbi:ABC transporter ATP-binding protein [Neisseria montereyensis]|uniref:ABC transporter ATP-binding protein n=1 Tax=Neisseria montereyensis TaxID=2973938 RepID=A0ABT2FE39_9NEIS|nr:ABC transporter ATP-binding protein [Neisseria montereyensis]MCS4534215.1 ABC transporter ATP-binding protein [Neisseria montereyensis]